MGWSANLLTNPNAATQDTTGWGTSGTVEIQENQALDPSYIAHVVDNHLYWADYTHLVAIEGGLGAYHFRVLGDSHMQQEVVLASDASKLRMNATFQLQAPQKDWDPEVLAKAIAYVSYVDGSRDFWFIPLVQGVTYPGHNLINFWLYISTTFELPEEKTPDEAKVKIRAHQKLTDGINIDTIELRQYIES